MKANQRRFFEVVKLSVPHGKNRWKIDGYPMGKRERYFFATEKEAKAAAADRNHHLAAFGSETALPEPERVMASECIRLLAPYGKTLYEAVHFYRDYLDRSTSSIRVAALCDRVADEFDRRLAKKESSVRHHGSMKETLKKFRARFGDESIKLLDGTAIKAWLAAEPLAVRTRNRHLGYLRNVFGIAMEWGLLNADPLAKVSRFNDPNAKNLRVEILTVEQLTRFLNAVDPDFIPFFTLNAFTGLRREEVIRLDWSEVKLDRNLIDLPSAKSKNRNRKVIDVPANLKAWLAPHVKTEGPVMPRKKLQLAFEHAAKTAGIDPWPHNSLRHSFCSYGMVAKGLEWVTEQADHSVAMFKKHYREFVTKEDAKRYWAIMPQPETMAPIHYPALELVVA